MNDQYELTVIISNYNQEKHISETIDSVFSQIVNYSFKVIIVDDNSCEDRSKEIIKKYAKEHNNIIPVFAKENKGYLANVLRAKEITDTKFFCLLDADDYWTDQHFLQRAYDFLNAHNEYSIYEANVEVVSEEGKRIHPFVHAKYNSGTYSKEMFLQNKPIPITQTTGMFFRNCIFSNGIPEIMKNAIGTRSERSFEGDTGRFIMHLKHGLAYYDRSIVGVYRKTFTGIWTSLSEAKKKIITAKYYPDYYQYYGTDIGFFVNKAYRALQRYLAEKQNELSELGSHSEFIDEYEKLMLDDVYCFCKENEKLINRDKTSVKDKIKLIYCVWRS